jgi:Flp pilus assembly protein TadB
MIPRLYIAAGAALAVILALGYAKVTHDASERLRARLEAAEQQAAVNGNEARVIEKTFTNERTIYRQAEAAADAIQNEPGADDPISPAMRASVLAAVDILRGGSGSGAGERP